MTFATTLLAYGLGLILTTAAAPDLSGSIAHGALGQDTARPDFSDQWFTFGDEDGRMLVNMNAEGQSLMFICEGGSGQLTLTHDALTPDQTSVTVSSGPHSAVYNLAIEGPSADQGERRFMLAAMSLEDPVIQSFREIAKIAVTAGGQTYEAVVSPRMWSTTEAFFTACAAR